MLQITMFQNKFVLLHIKLNIYMKEKKITSHKKYLFGLLFLLKSKENFYRPKYTTSFFTFSELKQLTICQK